MNLPDITFSSETVKPYLYVGITLLIAVIVDNIIRSLIRVPKKFNNRRARNAANITHNVITIAIYAIAAYSILTILGVNLTPLLASASIIGIILGIGARSIIEDFVTGLFFLSLDTIAIGDFVKIGDSEGYVEIIGSRTITLKSLDGGIYIIPNSQVKGFANYSSNKANVLVDLPIKANQEIDKILKSAETALDLLKKDTVLADALIAGSSVNGIEEIKHPETMVLRVTIITYPARRWEVGRKYRYLITKEFEKNKILFA